MKVIKMNVAAFIQASFIAASVVVRQFQQMV